MKEFDDIDKLFASGFDDFQVSPPDDVKLNIDKELFAPNIPNQPKKSWKKRWILLLFPLAMLAAYFIVNNSNSTHNSESKIVSEKENTTQHQKASTQTKNTSQQTNIVSQQTRINKETRAANTVNQPKKTDSKIVSISSTQSHKISAVNQQRKDSKSPKLDVHQSNSINAIKNAQNASTSTNIAETSNTNVHSQSTSKDKSESAVIAAKVNEKENVNSTKTELDSLKKEQSNDSLLVAQKADSVKNELNIEKNNTSNSKWNVGVYAGFLNGLNSLSDNAFSSKEYMNVDFSLEANYAFSKKWSISSGLAYNGRKQDWTQTSTIQDSVITGYNYTIVFDTMGIADTLYFPIYGTADSTIFASRNYSYQTFSIPISLNYLLFEKNNWSGAIGLGLRLSYNKITQNNATGNMENPSISTFGLQGFLRPEVNYTIKNWSLGVYGKFASDFKDPIHWSFKSSHFSYGAGLVVKYKL